MADPNGWPDASKPGMPLHPEQSGAHVLRFPADERGIRPEVQAWWMAGEKAWMLRGGATIRFQAMTKVTAYIGPCLTPAEHAAALADARAQGRKEGWEDGSRAWEKRVTAKYFAAIPVFVRDPGPQHWPMTSLRAAKEGAERARREALGEAADAADEVAARWLDKARENYPRDPYEHGASAGADEAAAAIRALAQREGGA